MFNQLVQEIAALEERTNELHENLLQELRSVDQLLAACNSHCVSAPTKQAKEKCVRACLKNKIKEITGASQVKVDVQMKSRPKFGNVVVY